jgi:hypothetical protein
MFVWVVEKSKIRSVGSDVFPASDSLTHKSEHIRKLCDFTIKQRRLFMQIPPEDFQTMRFCRFATSRTKTMKSYVVDPLKLLPIKLMVVCFEQTRWSWNEGAL